MSFDPLSMLPAYPRPHAPRGPSAGDQITGRIFGQYLTMQRCDWEALAAGDADILARAAEIASRPSADR
jgi:hypothetical protein